MQGADVFIGVSVANLLSDDMIRSMANNPIVFAMANPDPEILPPAAKALREDIIIATGRGDFPNQVNNVLCFPFIFRGALDIRATVINRSMQIAAVHAIKDLAQQPLQSNPELVFGVDYIIPKIHDPRLIEVVPAAVAKAAIATKVAKLPYPAHYKQVQEKLEEEFA